MCGISGFTWDNRNLVERMTKCSAHRGPDNEGCFTSDEVSLGHSRLGIIGATPDGNQPMKYSTDGRDVVISYNGELYNFAKIRDELKDAGYSFETDTDTEVICAAFLEWGINCVERFNGMWGFALYDVGDELLYLSRDRLGIKPLFYSDTANGFVFSSEIKSLFECPQIEAEINETAISHFLMFRNVLGVETQYDSIYELPPGTNLTYDLSSGVYEMESYWELTVDTSLNTTSLQEGAKIVKSTFEDAVERRLISDVGVGAILSGGLDSSTITGYMDDLQVDTVDSYTVRFDSDGFDEGEYAREVSDYVGTNHSELEIDFDEFISAFESFAKIKDIPVGVPNEVALYLLSEQIREDENYVVLSGEGADELFHGYSRIFRSPFDFERLRSIADADNPQEMIRQEHPKLFEKYGPEVPTSFVDVFLQNYTYWSPHEAQALLNKDAFDDQYKQPFLELYNSQPYDNYRMVSYLFINIHLPILLNRADNSTMANAVESRVPFLDHELVELAFSLPTDVKSPWKSPSDFKAAVDKTSDEIAEIHDEPKYPIKRTAEGYIPDEIINRKKKGFPVPFLQWKSELTEYVRDLLDHPDAHLTEYIDEAELDSFVSRLENPESNYQVQQLWMLASLELWLQNWVE